MEMVKDPRPTDIWNRRRTAILSALDELGGQAAKDKLFDRLSTVPEFTTKGPLEQESQSAEYYFEQALRKLGHLKYVERGGKKGIWVLTPAGREQLALFARKPRTGDIRTVDSKSRLLLPKDFANATVTVDRVGENEIRIRKAVVVPVDEFPLIEDHLKPLSDRDRDLFLQLLENPPEPTAALRKALRMHRKRHG